MVEKNVSNIETRRAAWNYDPAGNWYATADSSATNHRSHDSMNRLNQIGGAGKTVVEGTLNEPATVTVSSQPAQVSSLPGTSDFKFQKEIPVTQGANNFQITATDARGNARSQNYSVQVGPAQKTYEYDLNGNLLREKDPVGTVIRSFEWDAADRLKAIVSGSQRIEWTYNSQGQKVLQSTNGIASKRYLWDGPSLLLEKSPTGVITQRFYAEGEQRVGGTDAGNYYYTRDHLGSVREVVNQAGALQARYDYDAYGKRSNLYQNPTYLNGCPFGYTGHLTLPSLTAGQSELVLTHYRAYDPQLGRWLSPDPIGEAGGMNLYGYVGGDPMNAADPLGLASLSDHLEAFNEIGWWSRFEDLGIGVRATIDGIIPGSGEYGDPFKSSGAYDPCAGGVEFSQAAGAFSRDVGLLAAGVPLAGSKSFVLLGTAKGTNFAGNVARAATRLVRIPKLPFSVPTPVGYLPNIVMRASADLGTIIGRYTPWAGGTGLVVDGVDVLDGGFSDDCP